MKIRYFVNAMMSLEGQHSRVLCDPWITFGAESNSGLFNFPETNLSREQIASIKPDFIYVTHTHADHFDPITLGLFSKDTPIIISHYENNFTERNLRKIGFTDVRVSDPLKGLPLNNGDHCWIEPSARVPTLDSIGVFKIDGQVSVNANDNTFDAQQCASLRDRYGPFDLACVPFSYQGPYPAFYENLNHQEKTMEAIKKKERNFSVLLDFSKAFNARYLFPFAAGAIYGGHKASLHPYYGVGTVEEAVQYLCANDVNNYILLSEGCSFNLTTGQSDGEYCPKNHDTEKSYIDRISTKTGPFDEDGLFYINQSERIDLSKLLKKARLRQQEWQARTQTTTEAVFYLDVGESQMYRLCLADTSVERVSEANVRDEHFEIFRLPYGLMIGLLTGHYNWSNVKTQHMTFFRKPNKLDAELHELMSYLQI